MLASGWTVGASWKMHQQKWLPHDPGPSSLSWGCGLQDLLFLWWKKGGGMGEEKSSETHFCGLLIHLVNACNFTTIMDWKVIIQLSRCWCLFISCYHCLIPYWHFWGFAGRPVSCSLCNPFEYVPNAPGCKSHPHPKPSSPFETWSLAVGK